MTYWHCDTCKHPLSEWDAPCPRCHVEEEPTFPGVLIPILVTLLLFGALFL